MAVYATAATPTTANFVECNDDITTSQLTSELTFPATGGTTYKIQVGNWHGFDDGNATNGQQTSPPGDINIASVPALSHDDRSSALALTFGTTSGLDNLGAGVDVDGSGNPTEDTFCDDGGEESPIGSTVWYRITVPAEGDVTITAGPGPFDTVLQLFPAGSNSAITCNDDVSPPGDRTSRVQAHLGAGTYDVQVGGWRGTQDNSLNVLATFVESPGSTDPPPTSTDPPATTTPPPATTTPAPPPPPPVVVRAAGQLSATALLRAVPTRTGIRVRSLTVNTGRGARISIRCSPRRACPPQSRRSRAVRFPAFRNRRLRAGTRILIKVTRPDAHGRYIVYRILRGNFRRLPDQCIPLGSTRPQRRC
jgi:hypothetical protein